MLIFVHISTCFLRDLRQVPLDAVAGDLEALGLEETSVKRLLEVMEIRDMDGVEQVLGKGSLAVQQVTVD